MNHNSNPNFKISTQPKVEKPAAYQATPSNKIESELVKLNTSFPMSNKDPKLLDLFMENDQAFTGNLNFPLKIFFNFFDFNFRFHRD